MQLRDFLYVKLRVYILILVIILTINYIQSDL